MRKLLLVGVLLVAVMAACETKTPVGPTVNPPPTTTSTSTPTTSPTTSISTTTTTSIPVLTTLVRSFKAFPPAPPNLPQEMTLFFQLLQPAAVAAPDDAPLLRADAPGENEYKVTGVYVMSNGTTGTVTGELGGVANPLESGGTFEGALTAKTPSGCAAEREFSGTLTPEGFQWVGGAAGTSTCSPSPLAFTGFSMLRSDPGAPLPTPPATSSTTTTTSIACTYTLKPSSSTISSGGGTQSVAIATSAGCAWSAQSFADWITIQPPFGGSGTATVSYTVAPNTTSSSRSGRLVIAGSDFMVTQAAPSPDLTVGTPLPISCTVTGSSSAATLTVAVRVRNIGSGNAGPSTTSAAFTVFGSPSPAIDTSRTGAIAAGSATGGAGNPDPTFTVNADSCFADLDEDGTEVCNFTVTVDSEGEVAESNETAASNQAPGQCSRPVPGETVPRTGRASQ